MSMRRKTFLTLLAACLLLAGCNFPIASQTSTNDQQQTASRTATVDIGRAVAQTLTANPTLTPAPSSTPTPSPIPPTLTATSTQTATPSPTPLHLEGQLDTYSFTVDLYESERAIEVKETLEYRNRTGQPLNRVPFIVEPLRYAGSVFEIHSLKTDTFKEVDWELEKAILWVSLPGVLAPGDWIEFRLSYRLELPQLAGIFGASSLTYSFTNWYPFIPPFQEDWVISPKTYRGEYLTYPSSDFNFRLRFPEGEREGDLAAPAPIHWKEDVAICHLKAARTFTWAMVYGYLELEEKVGDIEVHAFYYPQHEVGGPVVLETMVDALTLYQELLGSYPYESLTLVELNYGNGMEYDGFFYLGSTYFSRYPGGVTNNLVLITAHETAHNWFFGVVGSNQAEEPWLDEALAMTMEGLFIEQLYPDLKDWWWGWRVTWFSPKGNVNSSIYDFANYEDYRDAVYLRGVLMIRDLREAMGDQAFFDFLLAYQATYRHQIVTGEDFWALAQEFTKEDLTPIREAYFKE